MPTKVTLPELISSIVSRELEGVHTIEVGRVEKVGSKTIDVQPVTKKVLNGSAIKMPLFKDVPPVFIQGGASYEAYPIAVGDYCLLFVSESCIDRWYNGEDDQEPNEDRRFDYSDSFALVGINPLSTAKDIPSVITTEGDKEITGDYTHTGNYNQTGNFTLIGNLAVTGDIILNGVSLQDFVDNHTHPAGSPPGNTGTPN